MQTVTGRADMTIEHTGARIIMEIITDSGAGHADQDNFGGNKMKSSTIKVILSRTAFFISLIL
jgi:hypothetical protein